MYEITSKPLVRRTLATLRRAEFGFFGVVVYTRVHTPRRCGQLASAGEVLLYFSDWRGLRTSWLIVAMLYGPCTENGRDRPGRVRRKSIVGVKAERQPDARPDFLF